MEKALSLAYHYLSFRPRSVREVERFLHKKSLKYAFTPGDIQATLELLKDQGYLNDMAFIKSFVHSRNSLKPKSKRVLEMELKKAGVSGASIDLFFGENPTDEGQLARQALQKKMKSLTSITDEKKRYTKAVSFLQRRGFSYDVAREAYLQLNGR